MKKLMAVISLLALLGAAASAAAQVPQDPAGPQGLAGQGRGGRFARMYNPQTVETVSGEVVRVEKKAPGRRGFQGVHLILKTDKETISVHLGPSRYLEQQKITFAPQDRIEVTGSRITFRGQPALIAAEVQKGDRVIKLRDASGVPVWAGRAGQR